MPNTAVCIYSCLCHQFKRCLRALWVRVLLFRLLCQINYLILFERRQKRLLEVTLQQKREKRWETGKKYWQNGNYQVNTINKEADSLGWRFRVFDLNLPSNRTKRKTSSPVQMMCLSHSTQRCHLFSNGLKCSMLFSICRSNLWW